MKLEQLKKRLDKQRPMTTISVRFPVDVLDDLKRVLGELSAHRK